MRTSWWHSCQTLNPCWSWDILNFKTDFSFQTYQFWHLNVEEAKILLTCNQVHLLLLLLLGQICQHCTPPSSIIHSLHCKVVAWIGTYIVIIGYGSYRSSKGELWVFFFLSVFFFILYILSFSICQYDFFTKRGKERKNPMKPIFSMITSNMISTNLVAIDPFDVSASYYRQSQDDKFYFVLF